MKKVNTKGKGLPLRCRNSIEVNFATSDKAGCLRLCDKGSDCASVAKVVLYFGTQWQ